MPRPVDLSTATGTPNSTDPSQGAPTSLTSMLHPVSTAPAPVSCFAIGRDPFTPSSQASQATQESQASQASAPGITDAQMERVRRNIAKPLVDAHRRHLARQKEEKLRQQSFRQPSMSTVASVQIPPSPNVTKKLAKSVSMFHSAVAFQPQSPGHSGTQISTGPPSQQCSKNGTTLSDDEVNTPKGGSISDDTEGEDDGL